VTKTGASTLFIALPAPPEVGIASLLDADFDEDRDVDAGGLAPTSVRKDAAGDRLPICEGAGGRWDDETIRCAAL
jgi:hypothetical protein